MKKHIQSFVLTAVMVLVNQAWAQVKPASQVKPGNPVKPNEILEPTQDSKLNQERENTRLMIENVTADQKTALDYSTTLGNKLNVIKPGKKAKAVVGAQSKTTAESDDSKMSPIALGQWPNILAPSDKKLLVNPRPRGMKNEDDGSLVYTPDFSRQRLTFGVLNDNPFIDLPNKELENESSVIAGKKTDVDIEKSLS